ncbi:methionine synthase [Enterococcus sp. AZ109]|uniref:methionine synthase n=1 Tax=Enterococcus sp. AZ109 TaxID=2774634 RepID=UPI003F220126
MTDLDKKEILRYLGYRRKQELTMAVDQEIDELMTEVLAIAKPRYTFRIFDCQSNETSKTIEVIGTDLVFKGKSIYNHLKHAKKVALLAATLGIEVERKIRQYSLTAMSKSLILDSCCTEYIEKICDQVECEIEDTISAENLTLNRRFSPGYGDLALDIQPDFLAVLEADRRIGLNLSESLLMIPRKSVTAIIGLFDDPKLARPRRKKISCSDCSMKETCSYRR